MALVERKGAYIEEPKGEVVMMVRARARAGKGERWREDDGEQQQRRRSSSASLPLCKVEHSLRLFWLLEPREEEVKGVLV